MCFKQIYECWWCLTVTMTVVDHRSQQPVYSSYAVMSTGAMSDHVRCPDASRGQIRQLSIHKPVWMGFDNVQRKLEF